MASTRCPKPTVPTDVGFRPQVRASSRAGVRVMLWELVAVYPTALCRPALRAELRVSIRVKFRVHVLFQRLGI